MRDPSTGTACFPPCPWCPATSDLEEHHEAAPPKASIQRLSCHSRQPDEVWLYSLPWNARYTAARFFLRAASVRMHFDACAVQRQNLYRYSDNPFSLERRKYAIQYAVFTPSIHPGIYRMPFAEFLWQCPPFTPLFGYIQYCSQCIIMADFKLPSRLGH